MEVRSCDRPVTLESGSDNGSVRAVLLPGRDVRDVDARTVADLLKELGLHRDAHLVVRGEDILTSDVRLRPEDEVEVYPVISGGNHRGNLGSPRGPSLQPTPRNLRFRGVPGRLRARFGERQGKQLTRPSKAGPTPVDAPGFTPRAGLL